MKALLAIILSFFILPGGYCQEQKEPVEMSIKSDKEVYEAGEKIILELKFKNTSEKDLIIYWSRGIPDTKRNAEGDKGFVTVYTSLSLFPEVQKIYLGYKDSVTKIIRVSTANWQPLDYQLNLEYIPPNIDLNLKTSSSQKIVDRAVKSNAITVKVAQKF